MNTHKNFPARRTLGWLIVIICILGSIIAMLRNPIADYSDSPQAHDGRFQNQRPIGPGDMPESKLNAFWQVLFNKDAGATPAAPIPMQHLTRAELDAAPDRSLYRLGHSTVLMKLRGLWWLTDPVFAERASPVQFFGPKRFHETPISIGELPPIEAVILSHDHLDQGAITALADKTRVLLTPLGVGDRLVDWWQGSEVAGLWLTATPAQHFSGRGLSDGNRTQWSSWVIEDRRDDRTLRIFLSGDTGYFDGFAEIGRLFGPFDLTLMESGAYNEQWPYVHMLPEETV